MSSPVLSEVFTSLEPLRSSIVRKLAHRGIICDTAVFPHRGIICDTAEVNRWNVLRREVWWTLRADCGHIPPPRDESHPL